jgi:hypothetical protein
MSRRHGPAPRSSLTQYGQSNVLAPKGLAPVFHSGMAQVPASAITTVRGDAAGRRTMPCTTTPTSASNLNATGQPTSANAAPSSACNDPHHTHRTCDGSRRRTNARADSLDEVCDCGIVSCTAPQKIRVQHRVRQLENCLEYRDFRVGQARRRTIDESEQQRIELAHPAPAAPTQPRDLGVGGHASRAGS